MNDGLDARLDLNIPEKRVRKSRMKGTMRRRDGGACFEEKGIGFMVKIVEDRSQLRLRIFQWNLIVKKFDCKVKFIHGLHLFS